MYLRVSWQLICISCLRECKRSIINDCKFHTWQDKPQHLVRGRRYCLGFANDRVLRWGGGRPTTNTDGRQEFLMVTEDRRLRCNSPNNRLLLLLLSNVGDDDAQKKVWSILHQSCKAIQQLQRPFQVNLDSQWSAKENSNDCHRHSYAQPSVLNHQK